MKRILIIYPHFPPSNLAGVHRARLFAQHLPSFGWEPIILTVHEDYYEERLDWNLHKLLPANLRIEKVSAFSLTKPRFIGDIGLRAFYQLYKKARQIIKNEQIDFLYIPIPSFYSALLARLLHKNTGIKYGIDYIDPWVHEFPGSDKLFSRHWLTTKLSKLLEPIAIKRASLITGVAEGYYTPVLKRNPNLKTHAIIGAMPYGGEEADHAIIARLHLKPYLFEQKSDKIQFVYAGAMLPKAYAPLEAIFKSIQKNQDYFHNTEFYFIGTGSIVDDATSHNIKSLAQKYDLWNTIVYEYPKRIPYLDVLVHLDIATAIFILGSTEPHYTPSKTYQGVLSKKPLMAVLHVESSAVKVIRDANAGMVLEFDGEEGVDTIQSNFMNYFKKFQQFCFLFQSIQVNQKVFQQYSAKNVTGKLANLLDEVVRKVK